LILRTGVSSVIDFAKELGITANIPHQPAIALGAVDISLYEMVRAYSIFPRRGLKCEPVAVVKIMTRDGKVIVDFSKPDPLKQQRVMEEDQADMMVKMMQSVVEDGTAARLRFKYQIHSDIAGKTGTTQSHADGWFVGYTPNLVFGSWVGGESPAVRFRDLKLGQGANTALPVCGLFLQKLYADPIFQVWKQEKFAQPAAWVLDSMACARKTYTDWELAELDSLRQIDSLGVSASVDTLHAPVPKPVVVDTARKTVPKPPITPPVNPPLNAPTAPTPVVRPNPSIPKAPSTPAPPSGRLPAAPPPGLAPAPRLSGNGISSNNKDGILMRPH
jgi:membrane peptidoglycan carboxypeptidase